MPAGENHHESAGGEPANGSTEVFLRILTAHERRLAIYVFGLVPQLTDAEDILQETKIVLWKHFGKFEEGTDFLAWARKIAFHQILNYRRRQKRRRLEFGDDFLESVAAELERRTSWPGLAPIAGYGIAAALALGLGWSLMTRGSSGSGEALAEPAATLIEAEGCRWAGSELPTVEGARVCQQGAPHGDAAHTEIEKSLRLCERYW